MFSEILKIIPKLDTKELDKMEKSLSSRFARVAKKFGKGVANTFKGGAIVGGAVALLDKILNPLQEIQEAMDKTLKSSDDIVTNAAQFQTSTGNLTKLIKLGEATGLDQDSLFTLLNKYQGAIAQARANPKDEAVSSVQQFTGEKDIGQSFYNFIVSLQKVSKDQQRLIQEQIFGEKQVLKMSDFLQSDFPKLWKDTGLDKVSTEKLGAAVEKLGGLNDLADILRVRTTTQDIFGKAGAINEGMIRARDRSEKLALEKENKQLKQYENLATISDTVVKMMGLMQEGLAQLGKFITWATPTINRLVTVVEGFAKGPMARGFMKLFGKGE